MTIDPGARTTELRKRGSCVRRTISAAREGKLELRPASPPATPDSEHPDALLRLVELEIDVVVRASWATPGFRDLVDESVGCGRVGIVGKNENRDAAVEHSDLALLRHALALRHAEVGRILEAPVDANPPGLWNTHLENLGGRIWEAQAEADAVCG